MDASSPPSDAEQELADLRRRAYGPHPDIQADAAALARLTELEAARGGSPPGAADAGVGSSAAPADAAPADAAPRDDSVWAQSDPDGLDAESPPEEEAGEGRLWSAWHRLTATPARRIVAAALTAALVIAPTVAWIIGPHPDATLHAIEDEPDGVVLSLLDFLGADPDPASIRGYEPYRGYQPWFSVEKEGQQCLMLVEPNGPAVDGANCVPPGVELIADSTAWRLLGDNLQNRLPHGSMVRFHYRGDSVDVYLYSSSDEG
jgi:hypothetical protein